MKTTLMLSIILFIFCNIVGAQTVAKDFKLSGKGLKQHDFLYAGEWDMRKPQGQSMFLVRGGKVVWQYSIPLRTATGGIQEFDDATLLEKTVF